jgi:DNA polymerase-4
MATQRIIAHIDMDSYFASVEQQANPFLRGKPIAVSGKRTKRSVVAAASIEAKRHGVKTAMPSWEAKRLCPDLIMVPGDSKRYARLTQRFNTLFRDYSDQVEQFSIDESFLDLTDHATDYLEAGLQMAELQQNVSNICGSCVTCSIGIAKNKLIAKLASDFDKPDGLTIVCPQDTVDFLDMNDLSDICGIGSRIEKRLDAMGITTIRQLREYPVADLVAEFKSYGKFLHMAAHGTDTDPVEATASAPKSVGHSYTLSRDTSDTRTVWSYLLGLAEKVGWRLRTGGYVARRVSTHVRFDDFTSRGQQTNFDEPTDDGYVIAKIAWRMMRHWIDAQHPVRLIGVTASKLTPQSGQKPLLKKEKRLRAITQAVDNVHKTYGYGAVKRASAMSVTFKQRSTGFTDV